VRLFDEKFKENKLQYIFQAAMGGLAVAAALLFFDVVDQPAIIASFGASAFIAFVMPNHEISSPRCLIGGYCIGIAVGCLMHFVTFFHLEHYLADKLLHILGGGIAVCLAIFLMTITDTEHAPATGIALGFVINDWTFKIVILVLVGILVISGIQRLLKKRMINLI
jgi:CBS-domain-containing membrane protein